MRAPAADPASNLAARLATALALAAFLAPSLAAADDQLTASEFEAYSTGRTLTFALGGQVYGVEQYMPGRKVLWAFQGDECRRGTWYEEAGEICFVYDYDPTPQCWTFHRRPEGIAARFRGDADGAELSVVAETTDPLLCAGPDVGV